MTDITEMDFDNYLTKEKGWVKNKNGYEYVYDYTLKQIPSIMIKVLSSVNTGEGKRNKGSHAIRVFAVKVDGEGNIIKGYIKKQVVHLTTNWREDLLNAYKIIMSQVVVRARKQGLI
jgi:hypothetical protein